MNNYEENVRGFDYQNDEIDQKIVKKHFPRTNNEQVLEFVFGKDPNLFLRKNKILIFGSVSVDSNYIPESGFAAKLFNMLTVEIESHTISSNRAKLVVDFQSCFSHYFQR